MSESGPEYARQYEYNALNQLVRREERRAGNSPTALAYEYDLRGNRVREKSAQDGRVMKEFAYDGANRMVRGTTEKGSSFYRYDGLGRRVAREQAKNSVQYVVDFVSGRNDDLAAYRQGAQGAQGFFSQNYSYANGQRIAQMTKAWEGAQGVELPEELYIHEDITGSTRRFTTTSGDTFAQVEYDVWGLPVQLGDNEENILNPRYTNHTYDDVLEMYHAQFRFLDATNRGFTAVDPIKDRLNWYAYCEANPTTFSDSLGLALEIVGTDTEIGDVIKMLEQLTSDAIDQENGVVVITARDNDPELPSGTELIRRLVDNDQFASKITVDSELNDNALTFYNIKGVTKYIWATGKDILGAGADSTIYFNPYACEISLPTRDPLTTLVSPQPTPNHITLAHELIHAERAMRGAALQNLDNASYSYRVEREKFLGLWWTYTYETQTGSETERLRNELATVGLKYNRSGDITENMIRAEQPGDIHPRGAY